MPSPFPGMDSYLEGAGWQSIHHELSSEIARQLAPKVRPKYLVRAMEYFVSESPDDVAITTERLAPDVGVSSTKPPREVRENAVTWAAAPLEIPTVMPHRVRHVTIEIRDTAHRKLVTAIEVLSPTNKRGEGYQEYLKKRQRILRSTTHLMKIDLLRKGKRVPLQKPLPDAPYFVFLSRANRRPIVEIWPIALPDRLPIVPGPLLNDDDDVSLDLQAALGAIYDAMSYDLRVDYTRPPEVPLTGETAQWAEDLLREAGVIKP